MTEPGRRTPLALRLAWRQLASHRASSVLTAMAVAFPTTALVVVNVVSSNPPPGSPDGASEGPAIFGSMAIAGSYAFPVAFIITVLVGAAFLVSARRHERMLAILDSVGAAPAVLFHVVSAVGLVIGAAASTVSLVVGIPLAWLWLGAIAPINVAAVIGIALLSVLLGWAASVIPAVRATSLDTVRVLRGAPKPPGRRWSTARVGRVVMVVGLGLMLAGMIGSPIDLPTDFPFWGGYLLAAAIGSALVISPLIVFTGILFTIPGAFAIIGRWLKGFGTAPRLAARDAERN